MQSNAPISPTGRATCKRPAGAKCWRASPSSRVARAGVPSERPASLAKTEPLLAVLAFDNLSGDLDMAYFSDGVSEEILQTVARAPT